MKDTRRRFFATVLSAAIAPFVWARTKMTPTLADAVPAPWYDSQNRECWDMVLDGFIWRYRFDREFRADLFACHGIDILDMLGCFARRAGCPSGIRRATQDFFHGCIHAAGCESGLKLLLWTNDHLLTWSVRDHKIVGERFLTFEPTTEVWNPEFRGSHRFVVGKVENEY